MMMKKEYMKPVIRTAEITITEIMSGSTPGPTPDPDPIPINPDEEEEELIPW